MAEPHLVQILEPRIPKHVGCPYCGIKQPFVKENQYWRTLKALHLKHTLVLKIRMVCAKCKNPYRSHQSFIFPIVEKVLLFKEELWNIFGLSETKAEAMAKRDVLAKEHWW